MEKAMSDTSNAPYQVNLKTPRGTLLNLRAWDEQQFDQILDGLEVRMQRILSLEETIGALHNLSASGLQAEIASHPADAPSANNSWTPPAATFKPVTAPPVASGGPLCDHGNLMKLVPAGISGKTGRPYKGFYACALPQASACSKTQPA